MSLPIITGPTSGPLRVILQGQEGVGKTTWAANCPKALFITCEDGGGDLDYARVKVSNWPDLVSTLRSIIRDGAEGYETIVLDTIDSFERLLWKHLCERAKVDTIEEIGGGFGKGYTAAAEQMQKLSEDLNAIRDRGLKIILLCHVHVRPFNDPNGPAYDRYEMRMHKGTAALWFSWADAVLFACFDVTVLKTGRKGRVQDADAMEKGKATEIKRVVYTSKDAAYDAKNRHNLPEELPLSWDAFARAIKWGARGQPPAPTKPAVHASWAADEPKWAAFVASLTAPYNDEDGEVGVDTIDEFFAAGKAPIPSATSQKGRDRYRELLTGAAGRNAFQAWNFEHTAPNWTEIGKATPAGSVA